MKKLFAKSLLETFKWFFLFYLVQLMVVLAIGWMRVDAGARHNTAGGELPIYKAVEGSDWALAILVATITALGSVLIEKLRLSNKDKSHDTDNAKSYRGWGFWTFLIILCSVFLAFLLKFSNLYHSKNDTEALLKDEARALILEANNVYSGNSVTPSDLQKRANDLKRKVFSELDQLNPWATKRTLQESLIALTFLFFGRFWYEFMAATSEKSKEGGTGKYRFLSGLVFGIPMLIWCLCLVKIWPEDKAPIQFIIRRVTPLPIESEPVYVAVTQRMIDDGKKRSDNTESLVTISYSYTQEIKISYETVFEKSYFIDKPSIKREIRDQLGLKDETFEQYVPCRQVFNVQGKNQHIELKKYIIQGEILEDTRGVAAQRIGVFVVIERFDCPYAETGG